MAEDDAVPAVLFSMDGTMRDLGNGENQEDAESFRVRPTCSVLHEERAVYAAQRLEAHPVSAPQLRLPAAIDGHDEERLALFTTFPEHYKTLMAVQVEEQRALCKHFPSVYMGLVLDTFMRPGAQEEDIAARLRRPLKQRHYAAAADHLLSTESGIVDQIRRMSRAQRRTELPVIPVFLSVEAAIIEANYEITEWMGTEEGAAAEREPVACVLRLNTNILGRRVGSYFAAYGPLLDSYQWDVAAVTPRLAAIVRRSPADIVPMVYQRPADTAREYTGGGLLWQDVETTSSTGPELPRAPPYASPIVSMTLTGQVNVLAATGARRVTTAAAELLTCVEEVGVLAGVDDEGGADIAWHTMSITGDASHAWTHVAAVYENVLTARRLADGRVLLEDTTTAPPSLCPLFRHIDKVLGPSVIWSANRDRRRIPPWRRFEMGRALRTPDSTDHADCCNLIHALVPGGGTTAIPANTVLVFVWEALLGVLSPDARRRPRYGVTVNTFVRNLLTFGDPQDDGGMWCADTGLHNRLSESSAKGSCVWARQPAGCVAAYAVHVVGNVPRNGCAGSGRRWDTYPLLRGDVTYALVPLTEEMVREWLVTPFERFSIQRALRVLHEEALSIHGGTAYAALAATAMIDGSAREMSPSESSVGSYSEGAMHEATTGVASVVTSLGISMETGCAMDTETSRFAPPPAPNAYCPQCLVNMAETVYACTVCRVTRYCSMACRQRHVPQHSPKCADYKARKDHMEKNGDA